MRWMFVQSTALWTPSQLGSLRGWYDADDSATIFDATSGGSLPSSGNDVARWEDKSGGNYHVTQATAGNCPHYVTNALNGRPVIECTAQWLTASTASDWTFLHSAASSVFLVVKAGNTADPNAVYGVLGNIAVSATTNGYSIAFDDRASLSRNDRLLHNITRGSSPTTVNNVSGNNALAANTFAIVAVFADPTNGTSADRSSIVVNAGSAIENNTLTNTASTAAATYPIDIGSDGNGQLAFTGAFAEIVVCDATLSTADQQNVEGYLAHKWGLESSLPGTHPYYNAPPLVG